MRFFIPLFLIFPLFFLMPHLFATAQFIKEPRPIIEVKAGYFFFSDSKMRRIYNRGGLDLQISTNYPLHCWKNKISLDIYGGIQYLERSGHSLNDHQKTSLWQIPVNLGLKSRFAFSNWFYYYLGLGPRYFYVHQHNRSDYVNKTQVKNGIGLLVNTGFNLFPLQHFLIDIFADYSYAPIHCHPSQKNTYGRSIQVGGFTFGGGLGYAF